MFSPGAFFGAGGKTATRMSKAGGRGGKAKSTVQPMQPAREEDESASDESVQVLVHHKLPCAAHLQFLVWFIITNQTGWVENLVTTNP